MLRIVSNINLVPFQIGLRLIAIFHKDINKSFQQVKKMEKNPTMLFVVAAALTLQDGSILLQKRPEGRAMAGLWEFPGGKVESGETAKAALVRELYEEIGIEVSADDLIPVTFASGSLDGHSGGRELLLLLFSCDRWIGDPEALDEQELRWVDLAEMRTLPMPPADAPFIDILEKLQNPN
jgi:8-oxo-dGTP diphosphatase